MVPPKAVHRSHGELIGERYHLLNLIDRADKARCIGRSICRDGDEVAVKVLSTPARG